MTIGPQNPEVWAELTATIARARASMERARARPVHTPEQRRELQRDALSGVLGPEMQELARRVEAGATSWGEAFEGSTEDAELLQSHLSRMVDAHAEIVRQAVEDDETFDPLAPDPEVADPR